jgi:regulator of protease activity HflC (stomatin/prohibitin superfamily)
MLIVAFGGATTAHVMLRTILLLLDAGIFTQPLNGLFAILYGWILGGLAICGLLVVWLRLRPRIASVGLSALIGLLWFLGLRRHFDSPSLFLYLLPLIGGGAALWAGLRYASVYLLPVSSRAQANRAFHFLNENIWAAVRQGHVVNDPNAENRSSVLGASPGFVITGCDRTLAISANLRLEGVREPGLVFIRPNERVAQIIDLRPQVRPFVVTAHTQDGIEVRVQATVTFRIDAGRRRPKLGAPLPFNRAAAYQAIHAERVEYERDGEVGREPRRRPWGDLPSIRGEHILRDLLSKLDFDDLYGPHQLDGQPPRRRLAADLFDQLEAALSPIGIQLLDVELSNLEPADPEVYIRRARTWQTEWSRKIARTRAQGQAERLQILERARADARTELILDVGRQIEALAEARVELGPEAVLDQFMMVLETLMMRPQLKGALPESTKEVLSDVRDKVGK